MHNVLLPHPRVCLIHTQLQDYLQLVNNICVFQNDGKTSQAARCIKSRIITNVIDYVLSIGTFEQQWVVLKGMLKSPLLKDHVQTIGIDQSLSNNALYEHKCLQNTNKLYKHAGKCDNQKKFK